MKRLTLFLSALLFSTSAWAINLEFQTIDPDDFEKISKDLGTYFSHTAVSGAAPLGDVFGLELGLITGVTQTKGLDEITKEADPNNSASGFPHLDAFVALSVPFGITFEMNYLPSFDLDGLSNSMQSFAVKWTSTKTVLILPLDLALRVYNSSATLSFTQLVSGNQTTVDYKNSTLGFDVIVSKKFAILEPYFQLGTTDLNSEIIVSGYNILAPTLTASDRANSSMNGMRWALGTQLDLYVIALGIEHAQFLGQTKTTFKASLTF